MFKGQQDSNKYFNDDFDNAKMKAIIGSIVLFKAIPIFGNCNNLNKSISQENNLKRGFIFSKKAEQYCHKYITNKEIIRFIASEYGYDVADELNNGFYKNFNTVLKSTKLELYIKQILHYMTTYGIEEITQGKYVDNIVYIPNDKAELPEQLNPIKITIIDAITQEELYEKIMILIQSGIALSTKTLTQIKNIIEYFDFKINIDEIKNKEVKILLCEILNLIPKNPIEFLRFMVYCATHSTLLIKNQITYNIIKLHMTSYDADKIVDKFKMYVAQYDGYINLAHVFLRFKPLFLAFKSKNHPELNTIINKIRKLADKHHVALQPKLLDRLSSDTSISQFSLKDELNNITNFKKISLINGLLYRLEIPEHMLYHIRNGKSYVTDAPERDEKYLLNYHIYIDTILQSLIDSIAPKVKGKKIHIPDDFVYTAPTSEKKFFGHIPYGSCYTFKAKNAVVGVHWLNFVNSANKEYHTDLDLRLQTATRDIGWNNYYDLNGREQQCSANAECVFSGDMTTAPRSKGGAMESYYVSENFKNEFATLTLHFYNLSSIYEPKGIKLPFKLIIDDAINDKVKDNTISRNMLIDPNTLAFSIPFEIDSDKLTIGYLDSDETGAKKFYFYGTQLGKGIVSKNDQNTINMLDYMKTYFNSCLKLKDVLEKAGAIFEKEDSEEWDIDLDPYKVTKDQIINLFS